MIDSWKNLIRLHQSKGRMVVGWREESTGICWKAGRLDPWNPTVTLEFEPEAVVSIGSTTLVWCVLLATQSLATVAMAWRQFLWVNWRCSTLQLSGQEHWNRRSWSLKDEGKRTSQLNPGKKIIISGKFLKVKLTLHVHLYIYDDAGY